MTRVLSVSPDDYASHPLHAQDRVWTETSCSVDVWIEVLHTLGLAPTAALGFTLSGDLVGDQWRFLKFPPEDLRDLFGIAVDELVPWGSLPEHIERALAAGRLLTIEVDTYFLPDTLGRGYREAHGKSTIVPNLIDRTARRLEYFHNTGYHALSGEDYDGLFAGPGLPPYVEIIRLDRLDRSDPIKRAHRVAQAHLARRPADNPVARLGALLERDLADLAQQDFETFHRYVFGTIRQCGANAELAAAFAEWLGAESTAFTSVAAESRSVQLRLARAWRGRSVQIADTIAEMAREWDEGMRAVAGWLEDHAA